MISCLKHGWSWADRKKSVIYELMLSRFQANIDYMHILVGVYHNANILLNFLIELWKFLKAQVKLKKVKPNHTSKRMWLTWTHHWLDLNVEAFIMNKTWQCGTWKGFGKLFPKHIKFVYSWKCLKCLWWILRAYPNCAIYFGSLSTRMKHNG